MPERHSLAVLSGRLGAYRLHATHDPQETTAAARAAFRAKFEHEVDPDEILEPTERARRAEYARRAHFAWLAYRSAKARAARKRTGRPAAEAAPIAREVDDGQKRTPAPVRADAQEVRRVRVDHRQARS